MIVIALAAIAAVLIGLVTFFLVNGSPRNGTVTGKIELTDPGKVAPKLVTGEVLVEIAVPGQVETYRTLRTISVGASGNFKVSLPPGDYFFQGSGIFKVGGQSEQSSNEIEVVVRSGKNVYIPFQIDVTALG